MVSKSTKILIYLFAIVAINQNVLVLASEAEFLDAKTIQQNFKTFSKPSILSGQFEQTKTIKDLQVSIKTIGKFKIKKATQQHIEVLWQIQKPEQMNVCISEDQIIFDNILLKKRTTLKLSEISSQDSSGLSKLIHLIKLDPNEISTGFNIQIKDGKILVFPKVKNQYSFLHAELELDSNKNLKKIFLVEPSEDSLEVNFIKTQEKIMTTKDSNQKECL
ncbi:MAG: outer-membrane lipoprotein carrier protein LolA [Pseudobdellovibrio sp.]